MCDFNDSKNYDIETDKKESEVKFRAHFDW